MMEQLERFRIPVIIIGYAVGVLYILEFLPHTTDFGDLQNNVRFIYIALIAFSIYTFHTFYGFSGGIKVQRTVPERQLSDPRVVKDIAQQRGTQYGPQRPSTPQMSSQGSMPNPDRKIWDTFKKE